MYHGCHVLMWEHGSGSLSESAVFWIHVCLQTFSCWEIECLKVHRQGAPLCSCQANSYIYKVRQPVLGGSQAYAFVCYSGATGIATETDLR